MGEAKRRRGDMIVQLPIEPEDMVRLYTLGRRASQKRAVEGEPPEITLLRMVVMAAAFQEFMARQLRVVSPVMLAEVVMEARRAGLEFGDDFRRFMDQQIAMETALDAEVAGHA